MNWLKKLWKDRRAELNYGMFIGLALAVVIAVNLVPVIVDAINGTDTSTWSTDFVGGSGAEALFQLVLLVFVAGIVIYVIKQALS